MIFLDTETTSLKGEGIVVAIGLILPNDEIKILFTENPEKERDVIKDFMDVLNKYEEEPLVIFYSDFDIPFIVTRAIKNGLDISKIYKRNIIDLYKLIKENLRLSKKSLEDVAKFLEIEKDFSSSGFDIHSHYLNYLNGDVKAKEKILKRCEDDIKVMREIWKKLKPYLDVWMNGRKN